MSDRLSEKEIEKAAREMRRSADAIRAELGRHPDLAEVVKGNERIAAMLEGLLSERTEMLEMLRNAERGHGWSKIREFLGKEQA